MDAKCLIHCWRISAVAIIIDQIFLMVFLSLDIRGSPFTFILPFVILVRWHWGLVLNLGVIREEVSFKLEHEPRQRSRCRFVGGCVKEVRVVELRGLDLGTSSCLWWGTIDRPWAWPWHAHAQEVNGWICVRHRRPGDQFGGCCLVQARDCGPSLFASGL